MYKEFFDRRKYRRVKATFSVVIAVNDKPTKGYPSNSADICEEGMKIVTAKEILPGHEAMLSFSLPGQREIITLSVIVVWTHVHSNYYKAGVKFTNVEDHNVALLRKYMKSRLSKKKKKVY